MNAITEERAGSDVDAIEATARRAGDQYLLNGVKWHVTSFNSADYAFFQARLTGGPHDGEHAMFLVDLPSPGVRVVRTPAYTHTISHHHPIVAFTDVRVPTSHLVGAEGDGMTFAYEWFRFERLMVAARCLGAAERLTSVSDVVAGPFFSPDGTRLAVTIFAGSQGTADIWIFDLTRGTGTRLTFSTASTVSTAVPWAVMWNSCRSAL